MPKLRKKQFLYFKNSERLEEIVKSSNNDKNGIIRTYYKVQNREKEYSVNHILKEIENKNIELYDETEITEAKIKELCPNMAK